MVDPKCTWVLLSEVLLGPNLIFVQSISVIGPAFLAEIGPYKQIGPVSSTLVERESKYPISSSTLFTLRSETYRVL